MPEHSLLCLCMGKHVQQRRETGWNIEDPSNRQRARKRGEERKARGGCGQETRLHHHMSAVVQCWKTPKSCPFGSRSAVCLPGGETRCPHAGQPHLWPNLGGFRVGKAFIAAKRSRRGVAIPLLMETKVSHGLICCLSPEMKMGFVTCLALFISLQ